MIESSVLFGMRMAFEEGAHRLGMEKDDLTIEDMERLQLEVLIVLSAIPNLTRFVVRHQRSLGYHLRELLPKLVLWYYLFDRIVNLAMSVIGKDPKMEWVMGPTERHCTSCSAFSGKVKRQSQWRARGAYPGGRMLECKGYHCLCQFVLSTKPMSKGPLPMV